MSRLRKTDQLFGRAGNRPAGARRTGRGADWRRQGVTLIELLAVIAILGIVVLIAYPSYTDAVRKSRRADAVMSLLKLQLLQEQYRASHPRYAISLSELGWADDPAPSHDGYYEVVLETVDEPRTGFRARAVPQPGSDQANDACALFVLDEGGPDLAASSDPDCWSR